MYGSESKSTEPAAATSAVVLPSPSAAYEAIGAKPLLRVTPGVAPIGAPGKRAGRVAGARTSSAMTEMMRARQRRMHLGTVGQLAGQRRQRDELADEHVPVPVCVLVPPLREHQRLAPDHAAEAVVHLRRHDQV